MWIKSGVDHVSNAEVHVIFRQLLEIGGNRGHSMIPTSLRKKRLIYFAFLQLFYTWLVTSVRRDPS